MNYTLKELVNHFQEKLDLKRNEFGDCVIESRDELLNIDAISDWANKRGFSLHIRAEVNWKDQVIIKTTVTNLRGDLDENKRYPVLA